MNKITTFLASVAALAATACTSYEIDMPQNPDEPEVGPEVSTDVIYQANPRFFAKSECLKAVNDQLSRIEEMGTDILWLMPIYPCGELNAIGSPYCVRDFTAVNPQYGTLDDLKDLVNNAHAKGLKVILDWIANHTSWDHPWITQYPDRYEKDANGNIVSPDSWSDVAQLDFSNSDTRAAMTEAMTYWVKEADIDGYRCDYADGVPEDYWTELNTALKAINPDIILLAETSRTSFYDCNFDMIYDWSSASTIASAFTGGKPTKVVEEASESLADVPEGKSILRFVFNHDTAAENAVDKLFGSSEAIPAAYVLTSMLGGTPMIYSSMDVEGLTGTLSFFNYNVLTFSDELTARYAKINSAFKESSEVRRGELSDYSDSHVVCFTRAIPDHYLLVAVNTTSSSQTVHTPISLAGRTMTDLITGSAETVPVEINLEPYAYKILMN